MACCQQRERAAPSGDTQTRMRPCRSTHRP
jgi:hypothetical protein